MKHTYFFQSKRALLVLSGFLMIGLAGCSMRSGTFYSQIDNDKMETHSSSGNPVDLSGAGHMNFSYTLPAYDAGKVRQELTFGTDEPLEDGSFIALNTQFLRGVMSWQIVEEGDVPEEALLAFRKIRTKSRPQ